MAHTVSSILTDDTLNRIIAIESRGKLKAKAPTSSALGLFQFLKATWMGTVRKHRPDLLKGRSEQAVLALRMNGTVCIELGARFTEDNAETLGDGYTDGDLYLAHFLGVGAAKKFLRANPKASAATLAGSDAVRANRSILAGKTAGQVRAWAARSMENRWDECGNTDWVTQYYDPTSSFATPVEAAVEEEPTETEEEVVDDEAEPDPKAKGKPVETPSEDSGFGGTVKSVFKSKIAWLTGLLGGGAAGSSVSTDPEAQHLIWRLLSKPSMWLFLCAIVIAGLIIYIRWKDHGKGKS